MFYLLTAKAADGRQEFLIFKKLKPAENRYFRLFAALTRKYHVEAADGGLAMIVGCWLHQVETDDVAKAKNEVKHNRARTLYSSADPMCGPRIIVDALFESCIRTANGSEAPKDWRSVQRASLTQPMERRRRRRRT